MKKLYVWILTVFILFFTVKSAIAADTLIMADDGEISSNANWSAIMAQDAAVYYEGSNGIKITHNVQWEVPNHWLKANWSYPTDPLKLEGWSLSDADRAWGSGIGIYYNNNNYIYLEVGGGTGFRPKFRKYESGASDLFTNTSCSTLNGDQWLNSSWHIVHISEDIHNFAINVTDSTGAWTCGYGGQINVTWMDTTNTLTPITRTDTDSRYEHFDKILAWNVDTSVPPVIPINNSFETTGSFTQVGSSTITSTNFQEVITGTLTVNNQTDGYITSILNTESNQAALTSCRITLDGDEHSSESNRSNTANSYGSMYLTTGHIENITVGTHNVTLECRKGNSFQYTISNAEIIAHLLHDSNATSLPHDELSYSGSVGSDSFTLIQEVNFTGSNFTRSPLNKHTILDVRESITYVSESNITTLFELNGTYNCSQIKRYGAAATTGSTAHFCTLKNFPDDTVLPIRIFAKSDSSDGSISGTINIKEMLGEINDSNHIVMGNNAITSTTYTTIDDVTVEKLGGAEYGIVAKASIPSQSNDGASQISYRFNLSSLSGEIIRDVNAADLAGVTILQTVFQNNTADQNYTVELQAKADNSNATTIGGDLIAYFSDEIPFITRSYNFTGFNYFDNTSLSGFNITTSEGRVFTTSGTSLELISADEINNLTLRSDNYFDHFWEDINFSLLAGNFTVLEAQARVTATSTVSGLTITGFTTQVNSWKVDSVSGTATTAARAGVYNFTSYGNGYVPANSTNYTFSAKENATLDTIVYTGNLTIRALNATGSAISNFEATLTSNNYSWSQTLNTTNGRIDFKVINGTYNVTVDSNASSTGNQTGITLFNTSTTYTLQLYEENAFNISFYDIESLKLIDYGNITLEIISDIFANNYSTSTGLLKITLLFPTTYTLRYTGYNTNNSVMYPEKFYRFTLQDETFNNIDLYLANGTKAQNVTITIIDENNNKLQNAIVKATRYDINTNSYLVEEIASTNFEGETVMSLVIAEEFYKFIVEFPEGTQVEETSGFYIYDTELTIQVKLREDVGATYYGTQRLFENISFDEVTDQFRWFYNDPNNILDRACIHVYKIDALNGSRLFNSSCSTSSTSTLYAGVEPVNGTSYRAITYVYNNGESNYISELWHTYVAENPTGALGLFLAALVLIVSIALGFWNPIVAVMLFGVSFVFLRMLQIINLSWGIVASIVVVAIVISYMISKKS